MKTYLIAIAALTICFSATATANAQDLASRKQLSPMVGYSPAHAGSRIDHDVRFNLSFRLPAGKLFVDLDAEYILSDNTWASQFRHDGGLLLVNNSQETNGFSVSAGLAKSVHRNTTIGLGVTGSYFDLGQQLNESVTEFPSGTEITDSGLVLTSKDVRFFAPGLFLQTDLSFPVKSGLEFYLKQKTNLLYVGNRANSSLGKTWLSFTFYGGIRFTL